MPRVWRRFLCVFYYRPMDTTERFSDRVEDYVKYRPGYPDELIPFLHDAIGLMPTWTVADVGSGTGLLSRLFLDYGNRVFGVEPNAAMRFAGSECLREYGRFHAVGGTAEATTLKGRTINLVAAGQAFHWFDALAARTEFQRILVPGGFAALVWNDRKIDATPFLEQYEALLLSEGIDYAAVNHRNVDAAQLGAFFGAEPFAVQEFQNRQVFDWDGLYGRAMSSSYIPGPGHERHGAFVEKLRGLFDRNAQDGLVAFEYDTRLYYGRLT
ncbi:MAG: hypothetical protein AMXMBFR82_09970 [Candidatus Hydrogenedentota bacterium]